MNGYCEVERKHLALLAFKQYRNDVLGIELLAAGLESEIYRVQTLGHTYALKLPFPVVASNANDENISYKDVLSQEWNILSEIDRLNKESNDSTRAVIPAPIPLFLGTIDSNPFLIQTFITNDNSSVLSKKSLSVLAAIHKLEPTPNFLPVAHEPEQTASATIVSRIVLRLQKLRHLHDIGGAFAWVDSETLLSILRTDTNANHFLHMDFGAANVLTLNHEVSAVIDWSNAMIGSQLIELARLDAYGEHSWADLKDFMVCNNVVFHQLPYSIYKLDSILMLCLVFLSEAPCADQAQLFLKRLLDTEQVILTELSTTRPVL